MGEVNGPFPDFLDREVDFPHGSRYVLLEPLTSLRECQDGTPAESRILFTCRKAKPESSQSLGEEVVMKVKVQYGSFLPDRVKLGAYIENQST